MLLELKGGGGSGVEVILGAAAAGEKAEGE